MHVTNKLKMDLTKPDQKLSVNAVQGDAYSRTLCLSLYVGFLPWTIPEDIRIAVRYGKPDRTKGYYDTLPDGTSAWSIQDNVLTVHLAPQMLTAAGTVKAQIELIRDTHILSTFSLAIYVEPNPAAGLLQSEDYINWFQWIQDQSSKQVLQIQQSAEEVTKSTHAATQAAQSAIQAADDSAIYAQQALEAAIIASENKAYTKEESICRFSPIICPNAIGESITLTDSLSLPLRSLTLYGKTSQNGTPTPEAPAELIHSGNAGSITVVAESSAFEADPKRLTVYTPHGLPGIPVTSDGNFTDENGQQWICDEIDLVRGVFTKRLHTIALNSSFVSGAYNAASWQTSVAVYCKIADNTAPKYGQGVLCNILSRVSNPNNLSAGEGICLHPTLNNYIYIGIAFDHLGIASTTDATAGVNALRQYLENNSVSILYELASPVETPLSEEVLASYSTLCTGFPSTIIYNNGGAGMEITYAADTKRYIDNRIAALIGAAEQYAQAHNIS